jgi:hypothetical protein
MMHHLEHTSMNPACREHETWWSAVYTRCPHAIYTSTHHSSIRRCIMTHKGKQHVLSTSARSSHLLAILFLAILIPRCHHYPLQRHNLHSALRCRSMSTCFRPLSTHSVCLQRRRTCHHLPSQSPCCIVQTANWCSVSMSSHSIPAELPSCPDTISRQAPLQQHHLKRPVTKLAANTRHAANYRNNFCTMHHYRGSPVTECLTFFATEKE